MPPRVHFAVLGHTNEACVADLIRALWRMNPGASISIFNGGKRRGFFADQGVPICPHSEPLRYGNLTAFHIGVMRWLRDTNENYDFLVTLDHDVLPLRAGLAQHLGTATRDAGYLGPRFRPADPVGWALGGSTVTQINVRWQERWQPLFGTDRPYWAFNPVQVFTRDTVERMLAFPGLDPLIRRATTSRIWAMEEVVYPTLAVAVGAVPAELPGSRALDIRYHSPADIVAFGADPDVFLVHRLAMRMAAPDREAAHAVMNGETVDPRLLTLPAYEAPPVSPYSPAGIRASFRWRYNRLYAEYRA